MRTQVLFLAIILMATASTSCTVQRISMSSADFETKFVRDGSKNKTFRTHQPIKVHLKNGDLVIFEQGGYLTGGEVLVPNDTEGGVYYFDFHRTQRDWQGSILLSEIAYVQYGKKTGDGIWWLVNAVPVVAFPALVAIMLDSWGGISFGFTWYTQ